MIEYTNSIQNKMYRGATTQEIEEWMHKFAIVEYRIDHFLERDYKEINE